MKNLRILFGGTGKVFDEFRCLDNVIFLKFFYFNLKETFIKLNNKEYSPRLHTCSLINCVR